MPIPQSVGDRIAQARRELGVRLHRDVLQSDVAEAIGVSGASVSQWEAGIKSPREDTLAKLAAYLGVTPAYLRYGIPSDVRPVAPDPALDRKVTPGERAAAKKTVDQAPKRRRNTG
jgi:transcriptional regulator with XRE-family HTH domain